MPQNYTNQAMVEGRRKKVRKWYISSTELEKKNPKNGTLSTPPLQPRSIPLPSFHIVNLSLKEGTPHRHHFHASTHTLRILPNVISMGKTPESVFLRQALFNLTIYIAAGELVVLQCQSSFRSGLQNRYIEVMTHIFGCPPLWWQ